MKTRSIATSTPKKTTKKTKENVKVLPPHIPAVVSRVGTLKKTLYTMRIGDYAPDICAITYPLLKNYARKIGAEFYEINTRKFPGWPIPYETFQIYDLMQQRDDDWAFWIDADALVNPETPDWTWYLPTDTCAQNGSDPAPIRWLRDGYFRRDARNISSCNWHAIVPRDCRDFFRPQDDLTLEQMVERINPTVNEIKGTCQAEHLVSDYSVSRNIARFGLKYRTLMSIQKEHFEGAEFYFHQYTIPDPQKIDDMLLCLNRWLGGLRYQKPFMGWDDATAAKMQARLELAQNRGELKMLLAAQQVKLIEWKEGEIRHNAEEGVKALLGKFEGTLSAPQISKCIEDWASAQIAKR
jgi:hypothetical protein